MSQSTDWITFFDVSLLFCLFPTLTAGTPINAPSLIADEELPIKHLAFLIKDSCSIFFNRLKSRRIQYVIAGFFQEDFFYKHGFKIDRNFGGLVKNISETAKITLPV